MRFPHALALILALLAVIVLLAVTTRGDFRAPTPPSSVSPSDSPVAFDFEIASTSAARERGLSGRAEVASGYGMLFVFDAPGRYGFWMNDMLIPIDMLWLQADGTVVGIEQNVSPDTFPKLFYPPVPVTFVLETRAGESEARGIKVGSHIALPNI